MLNPAKVSAGWLSSRLFLFLLVLAALVAWDAYREQSTLLTAQLKGLVPDRDLVQRLEQGRDELAQFARTLEQQGNARLRAVPGQTDAQLAKRIDELRAEISQKESRRRSNTQKTIAILTGEGFEKDLENEIEIQLLTAERDALMRVKGEIDAWRATIGNAQHELDVARRRVRQACGDYKSAKAARDRHGEANPYLSRVPGTDAAAKLKDLRERTSRLALACVGEGERLAAARAALESAKAVRLADAEQVQSASAVILEPLDELIAARKAAVESATRHAERIQRSIQKVFLNALWIVVVVTLAPVGIKAFWYWCIAPRVEKRPPIRIRPHSAAPAAAGSASADEPRAGEKISAVSQELTIADSEELLVQPEFLQRSADRSRKDTKWLLDWGYPFTSIAARMVALDRIRATGDESFVISSKTDPFAEVGVITLEDGTAFVLQPRNLIGLVQRIDRPIRITRRWLFSWSALFTFQFRYLIFEGPGTLLVQGCRGVRLEKASDGRSIDQGQTVGFSANLDYAPRRSETFGAYLLGTRSLFNDSFAGGPGFYVYEEMPYLGKKSGITGRGLEGLTDGLLKVFGI